MQIDALEEMDAGFCSIAVTSSWHHRTAQAQSAWWGRSQVRNGSFNCPMGKSFTEILISFHSSEVEGLAVQEHRVIGHNG
jgi:hypothetical protein